MSDWYFTDPADYATKIPNKVDDVLREASSPPSVHLENDRHAWLLDAACRELTDTDIYGQPASMAARLACASCPVKAQCFDWLTVDGFEQYGYGAGMTAPERQRAIAAGSSVAA